MVASTPQQPGARLWDAVRCPWPCGGLTMAPRSVLDAAWTDSLAQRVPLQQARRRRRVPHELDGSFRLIIAVFSVDLYQMDTERLHQLTLYQLVEAAKRLKTERPANWQDRLQDVTRVVDEKYALAPKFRYIPSASNAYLGPVFTPLQPNE